MQCYPLSQDELTSLYFQLNKNGALCWGEDTGYFTNISYEKILAIAIEASRWDIRLLCILTEHFANKYKNIKPFILRQFIGENKYPFIIGVIKEFSLLISQNEDLKDFFKLLLKNISPSNNYLLFNVGLSFSQKQIKYETYKSLNEYKKWGFLCSELPILKHLIKNNDNFHHYAPNERKITLKNLFETKNPISINDYLEAINYSISRQHARLDLINSEFIISKGKTKSCLYYLKNK
ncbi:MAG: hypothetical protein ABIA04_00165 [Pseudomonadota bacterium]